MWLRKTHTRIALLIMREREQQQQQRNVNCGRPANVPQQRKQRRRRRRLFAHESTNGSNSLQFVRTICSLQLHNSSLASQHSGTTIENTSKSKIASETKQRHQMPHNVALIHSDRFYFSECSRARDRNDYVIRILLRRLRGSTFNTCSLAGCNTFSQRRRKSQRETQRQMTTWI